MNFRPIRHLAFPPSCFNPFMPGVPPVVARSRPSSAVHESFAGRASFLGDPTGRDCTWRSPMSWLRGQKPRSCVASPITAPHYAPSSPGPGPKNYWILH